MDSNDIERERGITILAKNCSIEYDGHAHQHRRHAGPRRLRRRGRARARHGRRRAAAGRRGRRPDAADALRHAEGAAAGTEAHRRRQQGRPPRRARRVGRQPDVRPLRQARRHRRPARLPGRLRVGAATAGRRSTSPSPRRGADAPAAPTMRAAVRDRSSTRVPAPVGDPDGAAAVPGQRARLLELSRPPRHRPHPPRPHRAGPGSRRAARPARAGRDPRRRRRSAGARLRGPRARAGRRRPRAGDIVLVTGVDDLSIGTTLASLDDARSAAADHGRRADARRCTSRSTRRRSPAAKAST